MYKIKPIMKLRTEINVPADKSISHRAVIISSLCSGVTRIENFLLSNDTIATLECVRKLGVKVSLESGSNTLVIKGKGLFFPRKSKVNLYAQESGTTLRILSGLLCGQKFPVFFDAQPSLKRRPMGRITVPLRLMNADIRGEDREGEEYPPLRVKPVHTLKGIKYTLPVASAQVKSALLFASLYAQGETVIKEPLVSRDHTERMLSLFGVKIKRQGKVIISQGVKKLITPRNLFIPGDFSSASFFIVLGLIVKNSEILIKNVNINPTRWGLLKVLKRMGANIKIINKKNNYEPYADLLVKSSSLNAIKVKEQDIPLMVDEIPILCVAAAFAQGKTVISGVKELKVKETDRINSIMYNLRNAGIDVNAFQYKKQKSTDWRLEIQGGSLSPRSRFKSFYDHRTAMSAIVLGMAQEKESSIDEVACINKSFPQFIPLVASLYK